MPATIVFELFCFKFIGVCSRMFRDESAGSKPLQADGESGFCPAQKVQVKDTTGAGDAFCAGVSAGLTYGKTLGKAVEIGTRLAASVITSSENVCPRFRPEEFGIEA